MRRRVVHVKRGTWPSRASASRCPLPPPLPPPCRMSQSRRSPRRPSLVSRPIVEERMSRWNVRTDTIYTLNRPNRVSTRSARLDGRYASSGKTISRDGSRQVQRIRRRDRDRRARGAARWEGKANGGRGRQPSGREPGRDLKERTSGGVAGPTRAQQERRDDHGE